MGQEALGFLSPVLRQGREAISFLAQFYFENRTTVGLPFAGIFHMSARAIFGKVEGVSIRLAENRIVILSQPEKVGEVLLHFIQ